MLHREQGEGRKEEDDYATGLIGKQQVIPVPNLSDGRSLEGVWPGRTPTCSSWMNLDIETISALEDGISDFEGCVMLISHGFKLLQQVAQELQVFEK